MQTEPPAVWTRIGTALDSAMAGLNPADQDAVVLRYFENRSLREVGVALGASEDAAQRRVCRALEKLRIALARTGHNVPGGALAAAIGWGAIQAAPVGLASSLTTAILTGSLASTASTAGLITQMSLNMSTLKTIVGFAAAAGAVAVIGLQTINLGRLEKAYLDLEQRANRLSKENARLTEQPAARPFLPNDDPRILELLGLRGDVTLLRQQVRECEAEKEQLAAAARQSGFDPSEQPPEDPEEAARRAELFQSRLLGIARLDYAKSWALALHLYAAENGDTLPASLADAASFFPEPAELDMAEALLTAIPPRGRETPPHLDSIQKAIYSAAYMATFNQLRPDQFELLHHGPLSQVARPGDTILLRERQAWPAGPDSPRLARTYAFVDGHSEIRVEPDGDFSAWEAARTAPTQP